MLGYSPFAADPLASQFNAQAKFQYQISGQGGSYATAGVAANIYYGYTMYANPGVMAITTYTLSVTRTYGMLGAVTPYVLTAALQASFNRQIIGAVGVITCLYSAATYNLGYYLVGQAGNIQLASPISAVVTRAMSIAPGAYGTGGSKGFLAMRRVLAGMPASIALAGAQSTFNAGYAIVLPHGPSYSVAGASAALRTARVVAGAVPAIGVSGRASTTGAGRRMMGVLGRYDALPQGMRASYSRVAPFQPASLVITARPGTLKTTRQLLGTPGALRDQPFQAVGFVSRRLVGTPGEYAAMGQSARLELGRSIFGGISGVGLTAGPATLVVGRVLRSTPMLVEVIASPALLTYSGDSLSIDGAQVAILEDMQPVTDTLGVVGNDTIVSGG